MAESSVALVTGGSRGIGRAIAIELARLQYDIVVNHTSPPGAPLKRTVQEVESLGARCIAVQALGATQVKGKSDPVRAYRIVGKVRQSEDQRC